MSLLSATTIPNVATHLKHECGSRQGHLKVIVTPLKRCWKFSALEIRRWRCQAAPMFDHANGRADPAEIPALNRGHWEIENRLHHVRDWSWDEDRSRVRNGKPPRNLACLSNAAISIIRLRGRFAHQPQAQRHCAAR